MLLKTVIMSYLSLQFSYSLLIFTNLLHNGERSILIMIVARGEDDYPSVRTE